MESGTETSPSVPNGISCKSEVAAQHLNEESELSQKFRNAYPKADLTILNYKEKLWTSLENRNEEAEINAFWDIMDAFDKMWRDENLLLQGYPMLTQFNVGIVYMLCHLFNKVGGSHV
jgi:calcineurin-like phosphoesterase family protein